MKQSFSEIGTAISPFDFMSIDGDICLCLAVEKYKNELFCEYSYQEEDEDLTGTGYHWTAIAELLLDIRLPELKSIIEFNSTGMEFIAFTIRIEDMDYLIRFAIALKQLCENEKSLREMLYCVQN